MWLLLLFIHSFMSHSLESHGLSQGPLSMGCSRQEYWSGLPFPSPGDLPNPGIQPLSPVLAGRFFPTEPPGESSVATRHLKSHLWLTCVYLKGTALLLTTDFFKGCLQEIPHVKKDTAFLAPASPPSLRVQHSFGVQSCCVSRGCYYKGSNESAPKYTSL